MEEKITIEVTFEELSTIEYALWYWGEQLRKNPDRKEHYDFVKVLDYRLMDIRNSEILKKKLRSEQ